ncbi:MAG: class-II aminoacyl-tRNA synthetase family protein [Acidiferrobacteraceae bacterium]
MQTIGITLPETTSREVANEIAKQVCYCDAAITVSHYFADDHRLEIGYNEDTGRERIIARAERLIGQMTLERNTPTKTLATHDGAHGELRTLVVEGLIDDDDIAPEGVGVVSRGGNFLELLLRLDRLLETLALTQFSAHTKSYNTLIPSDWLRRAGYFTSFPHSVTFAMHLREGSDNLESFATRHRDNRQLNFASVDELTPPEYCLSPALCYHTYGALEAQRLTDRDAGARILTASGRCFRYESKNITALDRLWEFSMREIIFVGDKQRVLALRQKSIDLIWRLVEILDLRATIETASDPFFSIESKSLRYFQMLNDLKYELLLPVPGGRRIAAASFNYHETFFGNNFSICSADGTAAHTACAAFGLERLAYGLLAQLDHATVMEKISIAEKELVGHADS